MSRHRRSTQSKGSTRSKGSGLVVPGTHLSKSPDPFDLSVRVPECEARHWQTHVARWKAKRTDEELASLSQHNLRTWRDWFHWSRLGRQLSVERVERAIAAAEQRESKLSREALSLMEVTRFEV